MYWVRLAGSAHGEAPRFALASPVRPRYSKSKDLGDENVLLFGLTFFSPTMSNELRVRGVPVTSGSLDFLERQLIEHNKNVRVLNRFI